MTYKDEKIRTVLLLALYFFFTISSILLLFVGIWGNILFMLIIGGIGLVVSIRLTLERWQFYTYLRNEETPRHKVRIRSRDSQ